MESRCSLVFRALSDETRQKILTLLSKKRMCVSEICKNFSMTQPSISHHLDVLKKANLVNHEKRGREVYYRANCCACVPSCCQRLFEKLGLVVKCRRER